MLADHINAAIDRTLQGIALPNPMQWEIRQLYPREYEFGVRALALIKQSTGVQLAADEAISLAQHAVNAQFTLAGSSTQRSPADMMSGMAQTAQFTQLLATILDIVENALDVPLDRNSMATARFITHLRFLLHRLVGERGTPHEPEPGMLAMADSMMKQYPQAYRIAGLVVIKLESTLDTKCSEDEILYLTLHVARLMMKA
ncbi:PRD domain-containing protein [Corynebacterium sp. SA-MJD20WY100]|uniref:BglG family transcription antiterminator n=1 Tax=Corynebacterium sp. SA-MJD20WY100 TaxID=3142969 RepID=UPI003221D759